MAYFCVRLAIFLATIATTTAAKVPAIYVFGDSTVDVGNNNYLSGHAPKANFSPYGVDYPGKISTGRFSNGFLGIDYTAMALGFPMSPPAFLSLPIDHVEFRRGVNFASAGSGILDTTGKDVIPMNAQIKYFEAVVKQLNARKGKIAAAQFLAKSLFYFSTGSNDLFGFYKFSNPPNSTLKDEIVSLLTSKFKEQLEVLYHVGARKFAVVGSGLIGCIPAIRAFSHSYNCSDGLNDFSFRLKISTNEMLKDVSLKLKGFKYSFGDSFVFGQQDITSTSLREFTEDEAACCGGGVLNAEVMCAPNTVFCKDRKQYIFWDWIHPSEALYKLIANLFFNGPKQLANPVNICKLVQC